MPPRSGVGSRYPAWQRLKQPPRRGVQTARAVMRDCRRACSRTLWPTANQRGRPARGTADLSGGNRAHGTPPPRAGRAASPAEPVWVFFEGTPVGGDHRVGTRVHRQSPAQPGKPSEPGPAPLLETGAAGVVARLTRGAGVAAASVRFAAVGLAAVVGFARLAAAVVTAFRVGATSCIGLLRFAAARCRECARSEPNQASASGSHGTHSMLESRWLKWRAHSEIHSPPGAAR